MSAFDLAKMLNMPELTKAQVRLNETIAEALAINSHELAKPIALLLKTPGKRLRPSMMMAIVQATGNRVNQSVLRAAAAVELLHLASIVHDDIIDKAETRHGSATSNARAGTSQAILLGDFLLAKAFEQAAAAGPAMPQLLAGCFAHICVGQAEEQADLFNSKRTQKSYLGAARGKTGALFATACQIGGLYAQLETSQLQVLESFGLNFGLAFQLIDDLLDIISTSQLAGKPVGQDLQNGNYTLPIILALHSPLAHKYSGLLARRLNVTSALIRDGFIGQSILQIQKINRSAVADLTGLDKGFSSFGSLAEQFLDWSLKTLVEKSVRSQLRL